MSYARISTAFVLAAALVLLAAVAVPAPAGAQPAPPPTAAPAAAPAVAQIRDLNSQARKAFDNYSFRGAGRKLQQALKLAMDSRQQKHMVVGETYLLLGITNVAGSNDLYRGLHYFVRALRINPKLQVPKAIATPQLLQMFKKAQRALKNVGRPRKIQLGKLDAEKATERKVKKKRALGLVHSSVDNARRNFPIPIRVQLGIDVQASKIYCYYRRAGQVQYKRLMMKKNGDQFRINIPAEATVGRYVHYYIEALDQRGRSTARNGSARGPNVTIIR